MKALALYLPQYHEIEENNRWWGKGYTEWSAVKDAVPLFSGHKQPKKPLDGRYYDLSEESAQTWKWQAELANKFGVYGFCIYHYWFGEKQLLQKPMEILRDNKDIDIKYTICWANETWTRTWYDKSNEILVKQTYGNREEWERHYDYLRTFFLDERYIKIDNKPLFHIYKHGDIDCLNKMLSCWDALAKKDGFSGMHIVVAKTSINNGDLSCEFIKGQYLFEPGYSTRNGLSLWDKVNYFFPIAIKHALNCIFHQEILERKVNIKSLNKRIIKNYKRAKLEDKVHTYIGACPRWDNTPRRGSKGTVYYNDTNNEFSKLLTQIKEIVPQNDFVYINAWNEWGEGCFLEPDEEQKYETLETIKKYFI